MPTDLAQQREFIEWIMIFRIRSFLVMTLTFSLMALLTVEIVAFKVQKIQERFLRNMMRQ